MSKRSNKTTYWCLDFDRCLGDVDALFGHYVSALARYGHVTADELMVARRQVEATEGSFDLIGFVRQVESITDEQLSLIDEAFIDEAKKDSAVLRPGATALLAFLAAEHPDAFGIMTFGNPHWQLLKIKAAGLSDVPCLIAPSPHKAREIATWYDEPSRCYFLPESLVRSQSAIDEVVLVDDKLVAFHDMHAQTRGYWIPDPHHKAYARQDDATRSIVNRLIGVAHLEEIIESERTEH